MGSAPLFDTQGKRTGDIDLSEALFAPEGNVALVHQKVVAEHNAARQGTSETKTRGQVAGGGKKPYRQKGTGRARQGSIVAPHYRKGGIVFGPHQRDFSQKLPKKMKVGALRSALSLKAGAGEVLVVEEFALSEISTRKAAAILASMGVHGKAVVVLPDYDDMVLKSLRNIPNVKVRKALDLCVGDIVGGGQIVLTRAAIAKMEEAWA